MLLAELPLDLRDTLPTSTAVRPRLRALARRDRSQRFDAPTALRLRLLDRYHQQIGELDTQERQVVAELAALVRASGSTLDELCGLATRSVAELLVEVGDVRRFTEAGFARFNGSAPLPASTGDAGEPIRHRYNPGGNRRINVILHVMAVTQLRCEPRAQALYARARARGHTKKGSPAGSVGRVKASTDALLYRGSSGSRKSRPAGSNPGRRWRVLSGRDASRKGPAIAGVGRPPNPPCCPAERCPAVKGRPSGRAQRAAERCP